MELGYAMPPDVLLDALHATRLAIRSAEVGDSEWLNFDLFFCPSAVSILVELLSGR